MNQVAALKTKRSEKSGVGVVRSTFAPCLGSPPWFPALTPCFGLLFLVPRLGSLLRFPFLVPCLRSLPWFPFLVPSLSSLLSLPTLVSFSRFPALVPHYGSLLWFPAMVPCLCSLPFPPSSLPAVAAGRLQRGSSLRLTCVRVVSEGLERETLAKKLHARLKRTLEPPFEPTATAPEKVAKLFFCFVESLD